MPETSVEFRPTPSVEAPKIVMNSLRTEAQKIHNLFGSARKEALKNAGKAEIATCGTLFELSERESQTFLNGGYDMSKGQPIFIIEDMGVWRTADSSEPGAVRVKSLSGITNKEFDCVVEGRKLPVPIKAQAIIDAQIAGLPPESLALLPPEVQTVIKKYQDQVRSNSSGSAELNTLDTATLTEAARGAGLITRDRIQVLVDKKYADKPIPSDATDEQKAEIIKQNETNAEIREQRMSIFKGLTPTESEIVSFMQAEGMNNEGIAKLHQAVRAEMVELQALVSSKKPGDVIERNGQKYTVTRDDISKWKMELKIAQSQEAILGSNTMESLIAKAAKTVGSGLVNTAEANALFESIMNEDYDKLAESAILLATKNVQKNAENERQIQMMQDAVKDRLEKMGKLGGLGGGLAILAILLMMMDTMKGEGGGH